MGLLNIFKSKDKAPSVLPSGSFTVDRNGELIATTLPSSFARESIKDISSVVLQAFEDAKKADLALAELAVHLGAINIKAREMRGGAMIFLSPRGDQRKTLPPA
ncbi:MAG TPA: hypothetical protein VK633_10050 [Verrucomicrobiae bacterium]|nr:hypothetical protein [Verrucomicrobiae bacterium]